MKIDSGDLNSVLIITYHDVGAGMEWQNGLHFHYVNNPSKLILEDDDHFETEFLPTDLEEALKIRDSLSIMDY